MGNNNQKTPFFQSISQAVERKTRNALQLEGKALPCSVASVTGSIVTVKFELTKTSYTLPNTMMPIAGTEYIRLPIQAGCKGVAIPADARLGGVSGLGGGTADLSTPANLSALFFVPLGNKGWTAASNANQLEMWGPEGVLIRSQNGKAKVTVTNDSIVFTFDTFTVTLDGTGWHFNNTPIAGNVTGVSGLINFGSTNLTTSGTITGGNVKQGTIDLAGHHHTAQGATSPTTVAQP
jgi:hypothetical protein